LHTERLLRIEPCFLCYQPPEDAPGVGERSEGEIAFGSFNNFAKVTGEMVAIWGSVLRAVPGARLIIKARSLSDAFARKRLSEWLGQAGVGLERVEMIGWQATRESHLACYDNVDIALDTFPYNGTTTTCEALLMGVPVVTLAGRTHVSRVSASILSAMGCAEWIANSGEEYVRIASQLAREVDQLRQQRRGLRERLVGSAVCDGKGFVEKFEREFRTVWQRWCADRRA